MKMKKIIPIITACIILTASACKKNSTDPLAPTDGPCAKFSLNGTWQRIASGTNGSPACIGEVVESINSVGTIKSVPSGCVFQVGQIRWNTLDKVNCNINNLYAVGSGTTVDHYEFRVGSIVFQSDSVVLIHGVTYKKE